MDNCKVSVIVPIFNPPLSKLRLCLRSLANQVGIEYELILVDDGSYDSVQEIIKIYKPCFTNIRVEKVSHKGVSVARNIGIQKAKGKFIVFCDADDYVENNYLLSLYLAVQNADLGICGVTNQPFPVIDSYVDIRVFSSFPSIYNQLQYVNFSVNKIFKKDIIEKYKIRFPENIKLGEDAIFIAEYLKHCRYIRTISSNLYHYVPNLNSAVHNYQEDYWKWEGKVIDAQFSRFMIYPLNNKEMQYMKYWGFSKIRGAVNYYAEYIENVKKLKHILKTIESSEIYKYIFQDNMIKNNIFFKKHEKYLAYIWEFLGVYLGIKIKSHLVTLKHYL